MSKQIYVKSVKGVLIKQMFDEAGEYLINIGFSKTPLISITDKDITFRGFLFSSGREKVLVEYKKDAYEEVLRLDFTPLEIRFIYDILLLRFNQIASDQKDNVFIYNE